MWELKAQICDMVPAYQETAAEALTRQANSKAYRDGVADLQEMIKVTYQQAYNLASEKANTARGAEQILNQRRRDLFARKLVEIPTPEIQSGALQSVAQIEAAMPVPLFFRDVETRRDFWRSKWSKDVLVSQYAPRAAVDVRRLAEDGNPAQGQREYNTMTGNRFAVGADYLHTLFFAYRNFHAQLQPNIMDVQIRATAAQVNMNRRDDVYNLIRDMHSALGFESDDSYGPWVDAPVRVVQGFEVLSLNHQGLP
ncbi:uncharacterized protein K460DRAFT_362116 [Cucurbitaria berberidis CBS 394.84]|uniref:Uncharacterized protein n=1 Tax=Cucurbitaria berberidis CBS 394.84 TaxID=1168544 RepID=A0A9P4GTT4_9PLEO|nr:uncharacterized protein K460DRAFT_362116 [Cucurbitaria berberidis CBS 394.84]KAF1851371.1 hypothetical protein K460DRAFT_362116 [Cucurbitaria berberidis CBS 394.84]